MAFVFVMHEGVVKAGRLGHLYSNPDRPDPDQELDNRALDRGPAILAQNPSV